MKYIVGKRRGIHSRPIRGLTEEWLTPPDLINALGPFDLDPCAHPKQFYRTAKKMIAPPLDGLRAEWVGLVWLNPPFSQMSRWLPRIVAHGSGIALAASRTDVRWFSSFIWDAADAVLFLRGRIYFRRPDGSSRGNAGHGSVLAAYGEVAVKRLRSASALGKYIQLKGGIKWPSRNPK